METSVDQKGAKYMRENLKSDDTLFVFCSHPWCDGKLECEVQSPSLWLAVRELPAWANNKTLC